MTRAAEFCYIAERKDGTFLQAIKLEPGLPALWTADPEEAIRYTFEGVKSMQRLMGGQVGFRKILAG